MNEFFMKYLLKRGTIIPYSQFVSNALEKSSWLIYAPWREECNQKRYYMRIVIHDDCYSVLWPFD